MHNAPAALESQQHLVRFGYHWQDGRNFFAQLLHLTCLHITIEIQDKNPRLCIFGGLPGLDGQFGGLAFRFFLSFLSFTSGF